MPRYIDADDLRDNVLNDNTYDSYTVNYYLGWIDDAPTADVVPMVRGEWEDIPNRYVCVAGDRPHHGNATSCSVCHDINPNAFKTNYCPNCGADMRRGSEVTP